MNQNLGFVFLSIGNIVEHEAYSEMYCT